MISEISSGMILCGERKLFELCVSSPRRQIQNERRSLERSEIVMGRVLLLSLQRQSQFVQGNGISTPGERQVRMKTAFLHGHAEDRKSLLRVLGQLLQRSAGLDSSPEDSRILCVRKPT